MGKTEETINYMVIINSLDGRIWWRPELAHGKQTMTPIGVLSRSLQCDVTCEAEVPMRFSDEVLDVIGIILTSALCVPCTGTWFNWRRDFKWLAQTSQNRLHSGQKSNESLVTSPNDIWVPIAELHSGVQGENWALFHISDFLVTFWLESSCYVAPKSSKSATSMTSELKAVPVIVFRKSSKALKSLLQF